MFLQTKDAVRTSALSTRWRYLFASVNVLHFRDSSNVKESREVRSQKFIDFVNGVLYRHSSNISLFRLFLVVGLYDISHVNSWVSASIRRNVQEIEISGAFRSVTRGPLLPELFNCKTLLRLHLCGSFALNVPESVNLPNLKVCWIGGQMKFIDNSIRRFFSSCPKLENLTLEGCDMGSITDLELHLPSLKIFQFSLVCVKVANKILLNAPNLESFECYYFTTSVLFRDVLKSILRADIRFRRESDNFAEDAMFQLVNKFKEVKYLSLRMDSIKILQHSCWMLPVFNNLTHLELRAGCETVWRLLPKLLHKSPRLEVLVIHQGFMDDYIYAEITKSEPLCLSEQFKVVKVCVSYHDQAEFKWVGFLLKIAKVLEKLIVYPSPPESVQVRHCFKDRYQFAKKLLALPRESKTSQVEISERNFVYGHAF